MKKVIVAGLVALLAACSGQDEDPPIQYGAPESPTFVDVDAAATVETTLSGSPVIVGNTQPEAGAPGLADQLVATLGGTAVAKTMPTAATRTLAARATSRAIETGGIDPGCVTNPTPTSVRWTNCVVEDATYDPDTGATIATMRVTVDGELASSAGVTTWAIRETMHMTQSDGGQTMTFDVDATLGGTITVGPSTIVGNSSSNVSFTERIPGFSVSGAIATTLVMNLAYQADPFCITSGTLTLEQRWTQRPPGVTRADAPNQGWRFEWTGACGQFTVARGS